jgi:hypothetical protein
MPITRHSRLLPFLVALPLLMLADVALSTEVNAQHHHNAKHLLGQKLKRDGHYAIDHQGKFTTSVDTSGGKITAVHVEHSVRGDIPVKKYKTRRKLAMNIGGHLNYVSYRVAQLEDQGEEYIGYSYVDDRGTEEIYWFPVDMIYDADTGAGEYVPLNS